MVRTSSVLIMAGGLGMRLHPLTLDRPKPMLEIGGIPILERLIEQLSCQGFRDITIAVNYRADDIQDHFGDGRPWGVAIRYVIETEKLGTAGALSLMKDPGWPLLVVNGDLVTDLKFEKLVDYHSTLGADATMAVHMHEQNIPYGVLIVDGYSLRITGLAEKPTFKYFINAGVYVLAPAVMNFLQSVPVDMTTVFGRLIKAKQNVIYYPTSAAWRDIGTLKDLALAQGAAPHGRL
jgi:NDP-sugar pyrophosphorylase family protein